MSLYDVHRIQILPFVEQALSEDWSHGDWSTLLCFEEKQTLERKWLANKELIVAGMDVVKIVFETVDAQLRVDKQKEDGDWVPKGGILLKVSGNARSIFRAERVAQNFFTRMAGIATKTHQFCQAIQDYPAKMMDPRLSTPGFRLFEKIALQAGGALNHRFGLCDGVLLHADQIQACGGIEKAVSKLRDSLAPTLKIEVMVSSLEELQEAIAAGADLILLHKMSEPEIALAVRSTQSKAILEVCGNIPLEKVEKIAQTGVDYIATTALLENAAWAELIIASY